MANPMHQFEIERYLPINIGGFDASFTNSSLYMVVAVVLIVGFLYLAIGRGAMVPGRLQSVAELVYEFVAKMVRDITGEDGMKYFPLIFSVFLFILILNLIGMVNIPGVLHTFTATSHIAVTFGIALMVFVVITGIGFARHGLRYLKLFVPSGVPFILLPILVPIEVVSYFIRPISLSVRLFANMMAGHTLLKVFAGFVISLGALGVLPLLAMVAFTGLEVLVAVLQAFVFAMLTSIYLKDALHMHDHH
ncbi:MAG: F0F1 ATP synthase subunit A [Hyphomicrobiaceae bacterium]